jgi:GNAT superfamily N-acetyltransferase
MMALICCYDSLVKYSRSYREQAELANGSVIEIRAVQPGDKAMLASGFERLSAESRRRRFFTMKNGLSDEELRYLTEFDGVDHYALGAMCLGDGELPSNGIGVARFVRSEVDSDTAEVSVVIVDEWQSRGVGSLLLERIIAAAAERGVRQIRATALAENQEIRKLISHYSDQVTANVVEPGVVEFKFPVSLPMESQALDALLSTFRLVAEDALVVPIWFGRQTVRRLLARGGQE